MRALATATDVRAGERHATHSEGQQLRLPRSSILDLDEDDAFPMMLEELAVMDSPTFIEAVCYTPDTAAPEGGGGAHARSFHYPPPPPPSVRYVPRSSDSVALETPVRELPVRGYAVAWPADAAAAERAAGAGAGARVVPGCAGRGNAGRSRSSCEAVGLDEEFAAAAHFDELDDEEDAEGFGVMDVEEAMGAFPDALHLIAAATGPLAALGEIVGRSSVGGGGRGGAGTPEQVDGARDSASASGSRVCTPEVATPPIAGSPLEVRSRGSSEGNEGAADTAGGGG